jgi:hypothetical protein
MLANIEKAATARANFNIQSLLAHRSDMSFPVSFVLPTKKHEAREADVKNGVGFGISASSEHRAEAARHLSGVRRVA